MAKVLFISADYVKRNSTIGENGDDKVMYSAIKDAQEIKLLEILGTDLYNKISDDLEAFITVATPIPADYKTLLDDYIKPALLKWTEFEFKYMNHFKIRNSGTMTRTSNNSEGAEFAEIKYLMDREAHKAEFYSTILVNYLCGNAETFPEYGDNGDPGEISGNDGWDSPIYLG